MTKRATSYLLLAGVLALAGLAGEMRFQYHKVSDTIAKSEAFYECCGFSRLELLKTRAVVRIVQDDAGLLDRTLADVQLVSAWRIAAGMTRVDVQRPALTEMFNRYGADVNALMSKIGVSRDQFGAIAAELDRYLEEPKHAPTLTPAQRNDLKRLRAYAPELSGLATRALADFELLAVAQGYDNDIEYLRSTEGHWEDRPLGELAFAMFGPSQVDRGPRGRTNCWGPL